MALPQTTETTSQVLYGPVKIEVSATSNFASPVDIGAANGVKMSEGMKVSKLENDNAVDRKKVTEMVWSIEWEQNQYLNEAAKAIIRSGIDTIVNTAGIPVTGHKQKYAANGWSEDTFIPFDQISYSGVGGAIAVPTNITITQDTTVTPATLTVDTDYIVGQGEDGRWGVFMINNATVDSTKDLEIEYDYTPKASTSYYVGGKEDLGDFYIRLTNEDEDGQIVQWTALGKANLTKGEEITFPKYNADDDRVKVPMAVEVTQDISLTAGRQLYVRTVTPA
jgi:basic membrane lipoprotein Med (substrate-binding protein (PBP1-ABC) superfamily)